MGDRLKNGISSDWLTIRSSSKSSYGTIFSNPLIPTPGGSQNAIGNLTPSFTAMSIGIVTAGMLVYHVRFAGNALSIFAGFVFDSLSFFRMGFILASSMPTPRTAQIEGMVLLYPMLILSGADWLRELWIGETWCSTPRMLWCCASLFVVGAFASVKLLSWE